jgi:LPXTG-site transpeptidase (sortase) family protein
MLYYSAMNQGFYPHTDNKKPPLGVYLAATVIIFVLTLSAADSVGLVPDYLDGTAPAHAETESLALNDLPELGEEIAQPEPEPVRAPAATTNTTAKPTAIIIPAINLNLPVQNPATRDLNALDALLQKGPARYVDSAKLGERGNVIIFAHSSNLPVVRNQMYKAFNRIPELKAGDTITIMGDDGKKYIYNVLSVRKVDANEATINLSPLQGTKLTLVTCDTLTSKSARFMLEADFIGAIDA